MQVMRICRYKLCLKQFLPGKDTQNECSVQCYKKVYKYGPEGAPGSLDKPKLCLCGASFMPKNGRHSKCDENCDGTPKRISISQADKLHKDPTSTPIHVSAESMTVELAEEANRNRLEEIVAKEVENICAAVKDRTDADSRIKSSLFNLELWSKVLGGERVYSEQVWGMLRDRSEANKPDIQNGMLLAGLRALTQHRPNAKPANGSAQDINQAAPKVDA